MVTAVRSFRFLFALLVVVSASTAAAKERVALVIGNGTYLHVSPLLPALPNPPNDAADIAASLTRLGFSVEKLIDAKFEDFRLALKTFGREAQDAEIAIIYFAGHGMEIRGQNWLIPVDAELVSDTDAEAEAINLNTFILQVGRASRLGIVVLDACRTNPFPAMRRSDSVRAVARGLVKVEPPSGILVAFSARDGTTADDGDGRNSPFAEALLANLEKPGLEVSLLFRKVRDEVMMKTDREQQPFVYGSLSKDPIYLKPPQHANLSPESGAEAIDSAGCDLLAAHPNDTRRPAGIAGVHIEQIDVTRAKAACDAAMAHSPESARLVYEAGRVAYAQKDYTLARRYFETAAAREYPQAMVSLGSLYEAGQGATRDFVAAKRWYEKAAAAGDPAAINALGTLYDKGLGVARSGETARKWYLKAAAAGDANACHNLGYLYATGTGGARDYTEARKWYLRAAAANHAGAMNSLGVFYQLGNGVEVNYATARDWFQRAAALGDRNAMKNLAGLYFAGLGVAQDYAEAREWYEKAADKGSPEAMGDLGLLYENGYGVPKNETEARRWYERAAAAGNAVAQARLEKFKR